MEKGVRPEARIAQLEAQVAAKDERIAQLEAQVAAKDERIAQLEAQVAAKDERITQLKARVEELERRVAELKARLGLNSTNSSKPPSSDPPGTKRAVRKPKGRRPGGQPGHEHHERQLLPAEQVDRIVELPPPEQCEGCQRNACTGPCGTPIPGQVEHRFRSKWNAHSGQVERTRQVGSRMGDTVER